MVACMHQHSLVASSVCAIAHSLRPPQIGQLPGSDNVLDAPDRVSLMAGAIRRTQPREARTKAMEARNIGRSFS